jgi:RNA polymerase sigma-70 factor (ECF subfamily)
MAESAMDPTAERAIRGERDAMAEIVRRHYAEVYRFCSRIVGVQAAEDAAQETFAKAVPAIRKFRGDCSTRTWLFGIALNICRNDRRKMKPTLPLQDWDMAHDSTANLVDAEALRNALAQLDDAHRDAVVLHEVEGLTYEECARVLDIPAGTVKSRLFYAFEKLRQLLQEPETAR